MSDIKLFRISGKAAEELQGGPVRLEKEIQTLIERHMETFLGVRFLASEHSTGKTHRGRIDSLGLDENNAPVIVEYKRTSTENVISQGLFYLDWLFDHQAEFELLVIKQLGHQAGEAIDWSGPRLLCIAGDFNRYDEHAVQQIDRNIDLVRYRSYDDNFLVLELVNSVTSTTTPVSKTVPGGSPTPAVYKTATEYLNQASPELKALYEELRQHLLGLGEDVQEKTLKHYFAFKRIKNFVTVEIHTRDEKLILDLKIDPDSVELEEGFTRDVREIGHWGTGDLEVSVGSTDDLERSKPLIARSYEAS